LPLSLILFGASNLVFKPSVVAPFLGALLIAFIIYLNCIYLCWIALWAKYRSMLFNLGNIPSARNISIFGVCDQHPIGRSYDIHPEHDRINSIVYFVYMFESLWRDVTRLGISEVMPRTTSYTPQEVLEAIHKTTLDYALNDVDTFGEQAHLIVTQGKQDLSEVQTALLYLVHRFFIRDKMEHFLSEVTQLEFILCKAAV
jgi:hypothetical protein